MAQIVRVKDKFQVTIPVDVRLAISIQTGDYLEASIYEGGVLLRPKRISDSRGASPTILDFLRKKRIVKRTKSEIDATLKAQRDAW
jgi:AbrB family looped-hinge helix DNA binding protein